MDMLFDREMLRRQGKAIADNLVVPPQALGSHPPAWARADLIRKYAALKSTTGLYGHSDRLSRRGSPNGG
jgi:hypothetical protein